MHQNSLTVCPIIRCGPEIATSCSEQARGVDVDLIVLGLPLLLMVSAGCRVAVLGHWAEQMICVCLLLLTGHSIHHRSRNHQLNTREIVPYLLSLSLSFRSLFQIGRNFKVAVRVRPPNKREIKDDSTRCVEVESKNALSIRKVRRSNIHQFSFVFLHSSSSSSFPRLILSPSSRSSPCVPSSAHCPSLVRLDVVRGLHDRHHLNLF